MLNKLRKAHAEGEIWAGVDVQKEGVSNNYEAFVWEPALVKINAIQAASEAATSVLSVSVFKNFFEYILTSIYVYFQVDWTIKVPKSIKA